MVRSPLALGTLAFLILVPSTPTLAVNASELYSACVADGSSMEDCCKATGGTFSLPKRVAPVGRLDFTHEHKDQNDHEDEAEDT